MEDFVQRYVLCIVEIGLIALLCRLHVECNRMDIYILFLSPRRFSALLPFISPSEFDALSEEFIAYQILDDKAIPEEVWSGAALHP